jgi:hypothetical protein
LRITVFQALEWTKITVQKDIYSKKYQQNVDNLLIKYVISVKQK